FFFFQAEDGIRDFHVTGVQTCALPISRDALSPLGKHVKESLTNNKVQVSSGAPFTLYVGPEETTQRTASFTAGTRSAEYTLTTAVSYELRSGKLPTLLQDRIEVQRTYAHNQHNVTGSGQE